MENNVLKINLNTRLQYLFLCIVVPFLYIVMFANFNILPLIYYLVCVVALCLIFYFLYSIKKSFNTFIIINEDLIQVCENTRDSFKVVNTIKKEDVKSFGYMSCCILATTNDKKRVYLLNICAPILAIILTLNYFFIFAIMCKIFIIKDDFIENLNNVCGFESKKRNKFIKISSYVLDAYIWVFLLYQVYNFIYYLLHYFKLIT